MLEFSRSSQDSAARELADRWRLAALAKGFAEIV